MFKSADRPLSLIFPRTLNNFPFGPSLLQRGLPDIGYDSSGQWRALLLATFCKTAACSASQIIAGGRLNQKCPKMYQGHRKFILQGRVF